MLQGLIGNILSDRSCSILVHRIYIFPITAAVRTDFFFSAPVCKDLNSKCSNYARYCTGYDHIKKQCPLTCNLCRKLLLEFVTEAPEGDQVPFLR